MVTLNSVKSSILAAAGYDTQNQILYVLFNTGKAYEYYQVPEEEFQGLMKAESKGTYMQEYIIDQHPYSVFQGWRD